MVISSLVLRVLSSLKTSFEIKMAMVVNVDLPKLGIAKRGNVTHIMFWSNVG